jgi:hypothetical protein
LQTTKANNKGKQQRQTTKVSNNKGVRNLCLSFGTASEHNANGVEQQSPASRSARWVIDSPHTPVPQRGSTKRQSTASNVKPLRGMTD